MYQADPSCMEAHEKQHAEWAKKERPFRLAWAALGAATMVAGAWGFYVFAQLWLILIRV
jgi:hypothetical protein